MHFHSILKLICKTLAPLTEPACTFHLQLVRHPRCCPFNWGTKKLNKINLYRQKCKKCANLVGLYSSLHLRESQDTQKLKGSSSVLPWKQGRNGIQKISFLSQDLQCLLFVQIKLCVLSTEQISNIECLQSTKHNIWVKPRSRTHKGNGVKLFMNKVPHHKFSWQIYSTLQGRLKSQCLTGELEWEIYLKNL